MPIPLIPPSSIIIAGPSKSGKTVFIRRLICENMLTPKPSRIVLIFSEWQQEYERLKAFTPRLEFFKGPISEELYEGFNPIQNNLLVLDDQMSAAVNGKSSEIEKYFVQGSHHKNLSIIFVMQNIFEKSKGLRTSNLNANYLVLYKNPRDKGQMGVLGRQMYPRNWRAFVGAIEKATEAPHSYILVDISQKTPDEYRLRSSIFQSDGHIGTDVYI